MVQLVETRQTQNLLPIKVHVVSSNLTWGTYKLGSYNGSVCKIFILVMVGSTPPPSTFIITINILTLLEEHMSWLTALP